MQCAKAFLVSLAIWHLRPFAGHARQLTCPPQVRVNASAVIYFRLSQSYTLNRQSAGNLIQRSFLPEIMKSVFLALQN